MQKSLLQVLQALEVLDKSCSVNVIKRDTEGNFISLINDLKEIIEEMDSESKSILDKSFNINNHCQAGEKLFTIRGKLIDCEDALTDFITLIDSMTERLDFSECD